DFGVSGRVRQRPPSIGKNHRCPPGALEDAAMRHRSAAVTTEPIRRRRAMIRSRLMGAIAMMVSLALFASACGGDDDDDDEVETVEDTEAPEESGDPVADAEQRVADAENGVAQSQEALTAAHGEFCGVAEGYVEALDRYGRVFTDRA